jgi:capsular exopolysaccharide synthesis family protein
MSSRTQTHAGSQNAFDHEDEFSDHDPSDNQRRLKTRRLLINLLSRWYWVALGLILGLLGSAYYLAKAPEKYTATSTLLIKQQTATLMSRDQVDEIDMRSIEGLNTAAARIARYELLERVAARVDVRSLEGLIQPAPDWRPQWFINWFDSDAEEADAAGQVPAAPILAGHIGSWMDISIRRGTRLIDISVNHEIPEVAKVVADAIVHEYISEIVGSASEGRTSASETLLKQSEEARGRLQAAESALATYTRTLELHTALEERETLVNQLSRRYLPKHPAMIAASSELKSLKTRFLDEFAFAMKSPSDEAYWKTAGAQIEAAKDDPEARLRVARQLLLARTGVLRGEITSQMQVFNSMLTRLEETNVNLLGDQAGAEINSLALTPGRPSTPVRPKAFGIGGASGLALGLAIAFLLVRIDNKFGTVAQTEEETGRPVLAAISDIDESHLRQAVRVHAEKHPEVEIPAQQELWDPRLVFRPGTSQTNYAEMFRVLRASITLLGDESQRQITAFTSALPGEGKSLVSSNYALAAAGQGKKTLYIDLDLRKPRVHRVFGIVRAKNGPGITDWLAGRAKLDEVIHHDTGAENLDIIFSGTRAPNPGELLNTTRLQQLIDEISPLYDTIIFDTAPILAVPDTRIIAPLVDNFCLVVRANYVPRGAVHRTLELLDHAGTPPSGLVLNGFKETRRFIGQNYSYGGYRLNRYGKPYQYGYGSYGSYGAYGSDDSDDSDEEKEIQKRRRKNTRRKS